MGKLIVAVGGTLRDGSSTEAAMRRVLDHVSAMGGQSLIFAGADLNLPLYRPGALPSEPIIGELIGALRSADAIVLASPAYHGSVSGCVKNVLDYIEEMASDTRPYLTARPVGCIASGAGWQGCNATLSSMRAIVHALRGWPTPLGIAFNNATKPFDLAGNCCNAELDQQFSIMAQQLIGF